MNKNSRKVISKLDSTRMTDINDFIFYVKDSSNTLVLSNLRSELYQKLVMIYLGIARFLVDYNKRANKSYLYKITIGTLVRYLVAIRVRKTFIPARKLIALTNDDLFIKELYLQTLGRKVDKEAKEHLSMALASDSNYRIQSIFNVQYSEEIERTNNYISGIWSRKIILTMSVFFKRVINKLTRGMK